VISGIPSSSAPAAWCALARSAGFREARVLDADEVNARWFAGRPDGLRVTRTEEFLLART
jgi:hypothetical protein